LPTVSEWQWTVWNTNEKPMQVIAPIKYIMKTNLSWNDNSSSGLDAKYKVITKNAIHPVK